ncbi:CoxG family protein [Pseudooceanicola aestuarii]|uniref:CoxG family protein n=1 Tax=Pseudooceanicola aestuarii TaxID=2697319 RepID=UPI0013D2B582|nr:carbon monoxide dehydrogenase subunit G [Pseudooceanicola aestuarii]
MNLNEDRLIAAPPGLVWDALLDPAVLRSCIPGCESLTGTPADGFAAVVTQKVGPVRARFQGEVSLSDMVPGEHLRLTGAGKGGAAGFARGGAVVTLAPEGPGTRLSYAVEAKVGGKLAQLGGRVIDGFTRKLADQFFVEFQSVVEDRALNVVEVRADTEAQPRAEIQTPDIPVEETGADGAGKGWFKRRLG